jgi:E1A/CREB-binding protein
VQRPGDSSEGAASDPRNFELKMEFIKALPVSFHFVAPAVMIIVLSPFFLFLNILWLLLQSGQETDILLVSCTGSGIEANRREQVLKAKKVLDALTHKLSLMHT